MKIQIPKHWIVAPAALLFVACVTPHSEWKPAGYYVTDQSVYGCVSFEGAKGTAVKRTAVVSLSLQRTLLQLLDSTASTDEDLQKELDNYRDQLPCWYETPEKDIELGLGAYCDGPFEITFHPRDGEWVVSSASRALVECPTRRP